MMEFQKYMHVERFGTAEVQDIEFGICYIFPKIDGSNTQIFQRNGDIVCGSRNRELSKEEDHMGFVEYVRQQQNIAEFFLEFPEVRLYGEWLVPHSLKTYRADAWRKFYVFDVEYLNELLPHEQYAPLLGRNNIDFITPITIINNPTYENLIAKLPANTFLIEDGKGAGEGIVIKNYDYKNKYGRQTWAKIISTEFKEKHIKEMGLKPVNGSSQIEENIVKEFLTSTIVDKIYNNIVAENDGWHSEYIGRLLGVSFYDLVREESWNFVKKFKNPKIDFKILQRQVNQRVKQLKPELF